MSLVRCAVHFEGKIFKIRTDRACTIAGLAVKLRRFIKLKEEEALFLMFEKAGLLRVTNVMFQGSKTMAEAQFELGTSVITVHMLRENCFGGFI